MDYYETSWIKGRYAPRQRTLCVTTQTPIDFPATKDSLGDRQPQAVMDSPDYIVASIKPALTPIDVHIMCTPDTSGLTPEELGKLIDLFTSEPKKREILGTPAGVNLVQLLLCS